MIVCRIGANREVLARGSHRPDTFGFGLPIHQHGASLISGRPFRNDQVISMGPADTLDQMTCANYHAVFVEITSETFLDAMRNLTQRDVEAELANTLLLSPSPSARSRLESCIRNTLELARADRGVTAIPDLQRQLRHNLLARLASVLPVSSKADISPRRFKSRRQLVQEAETIMDLHLHQTMTSLDLCQWLAVSERSLHYAFCEILGQTPMSYYRHKRLNAVRRNLKHADPRRTTVAEVSRALGFWHTGQFAADYRALFGELPSNTLQKAAP
jgi:AraC family ethanolamine operon transcriptional activator